MNLFLVLLLIHILGDFIFQPSSWVESKMARKIASGKFYLHILVHAVLLAALMWITNQTAYFLSILSIYAGSHYIIDLIKIYLYSEKRRTLWFSLDQLAHLGVIIFLAARYDDLDPTFGLQTPDILLFVISILLLTRVSSFIIKNIISRWAYVDNSEEDSLYRAGQMIGYLERLFVFVFLISGHWEAIGFLIAAKSVFRFGDLRDSKGRKLTEYILIGTLLSFGAAILVGLLYKYGLAYLMQVR